jgi:hypothetical protein
MRNIPGTWIAVVAFITMAGCGDQPMSPSPAAATVAPLTPRLRPHDVAAMSPAGRRATQELRARVLGRLPPGVLARPADKGGLGDDEAGGPGSLEDGGLLPGGSQAELAIAVDDGGQNIVVGFNDFRGFLKPDAGGRISVSGFMVSHDGGQTFVDGGQLPITNGDPASGLPQVFGDPDVKYLGGCNFIYTSIVLVPFGAGNAAQSMGFHRTRDCGQTWEGPLEIPSATNPSGMVIDGAPVDAADKELIDVDRASNRVLMSWTNFSTGVEISSTYSDDVLATTPTWSPRVILGARPENDGQGSIPRFGPRPRLTTADEATPADGKKQLKRDVYVAWATNTANGLDGISVATSHDGGATFGAPVDLTPGIFFPDEVPGNDRIHPFPTLAVDGSNGPHRGTVYVSYLGNDSHDGGDILVQTSSNGGKSFSPAKLVNARPGHDRSQWFPAMTTDDRTGRAFVFYYDQGVADSGDLTQSSYTFSDDGGKHWAAPRRLSPRTFHAGYGNDSSQPNLGDYNHAVVDRRGQLLGAYAITRGVDFRDGQPGRTMTVPEPIVSIIPAAQQAAVTPVDFRSATALEAPGFSDGNGFLDAGEIAQVSLAIRNDVTNPMNAQTIQNTIAVIDSRTPGATLLSPITIFPPLAPGQSHGSLFPVVLALDPGFAAGRDVTLGVKVFSSSGLPVDLVATLHTGTPIPTVLLAEDFEKADQGALPTGWQAVHGAGANTIPWITTTKFCGGGSNAAFHVDANDGVMPQDQARWERLFGPAVSVPADAAWVELEFDVCTDTEDNPALQVQAFDGLFLRLADLTPGGTVRSVLAEAFAQDFTTADTLGYPKHLPRNDNPSYFQDMSVWAGDSAGARHVKMRLPGLAGATVQLRFEYTQDDAGTCADVRPGHDCGVSVDNIKLTSFKPRATSAAPPR